MKNSYELMIITKVFLETAQMKQRELEKITSPDIDLQVEYALAVTDVSLYGTILSLLQRHKHPRPMPRTAIRHILDGKMHTYFHIIFLHQLGEYSGATERAVRVLDSHCRYYADIWDYFDFGPRVSKWDLELTEETNEL